MHNPPIGPRTAQRFVTVTVLLLISFAIAHGQSKTLPANTRFFVPVPPNGAVQQVESLLQQRQLKNALLITAMDTIPQAVWLTSGTAFSSKRHGDLDAPAGECGASGTRAGALQHSWPGLR